MHRDDRTRRQVRPKEVDILLRAAVGVIAVDPEEPDRPSPPLREVTGIGAMRLDISLDPCVAQRRLEVIPRRLLRAMSKVCDGGGGVRIDAYDGAEAIVLRNRGQPDGGFSLEAANLEDDALRGGARRHERQEAGLALRQKPRSGAYAGPGLLNGRSQIGRRSQQYCSNAAVRSAAMSRAFRPSILRRSSMNTIRPSLNRAICGDDGPYPVK